MIVNGRIVHQGIEVPDISRDCCVQSGRRHKLISFDEIIWAETVGDALEITYICQNSGHNKGTLASIRVRFDDYEANNGTSTSPQFLLDEAYSGCKSQKSLYVLINPHSGPGNAKHLYYDKAHKLFEAAHCKLTIVTSDYHGHAEKLMKQLDVDNFDAVVCVSGDGLPHEVMNGLAKRPDGAQVLAKLPVCQLPGGSGNAMCNSLNGCDDFGVACLNIIKGVPMPTDLMAISYANKPVRYSFLSQSYGIVADCDLGTDSWRWMGGFRFEIGLLLKLFNSNTYPCKLSYKLACPEERKQVIAYFNDHGSPGLDREPAPESSTLELKYGSIESPVPSDWVQESHPKLVNFYVGNMPWMSGEAIVFPYALPQDGAMDMISWSSDVKFFDSINRFTSMTKATHVSNPDLSYRKVVAYRIEPQSKNFVSIDGESYPCEPFQVEILPRAGCLLSRGEYHAVPRPSK